MPTETIEEDLPEITEDPTETITHYLVVHSDTPFICGVVDMLEQWDTDGGVQAVYLITPDGRATAVDIKDVTGGGKGIEYEICVGAEKVLVEYVCFESEESNELVDRHVYVNGYKAAP